MSLKYESEWLPLFPAGKTPRAEQADAIDRVVGAIKEGKKFAVLDLPTGTGKSVCAITISRWAAKYMPVDPTENILKGGTIITTQKVLQDQYMAEFASIGLRDLKSATNFICHFDGTENCRDSKELMNLRGRDPSTQQRNAKWRESCAPGGNCSCSYYLAREAFKEAELGITSYAYFLHGQKNIPKRQILVIDEAHNTEGQLMTFVEVRIDRAFVEQTLSLTWPTEVENIHEDTKEAVEARQVFKNWLFNVYSPKITEEAVKARAMIKKLAENSSFTQEAARDLIRAAERVIEAASEVSRFLNDYQDTESNWVAQIEVKKREDRGTPGKLKVVNRYLVYKTVDIAPYAQKLIYSKANFVVCMSATILNARAYCAEVGIPIEKAECVSHTSPFPVENRMIYMRGCGSMGMKDKETTLPNMVEAIEAILLDHKGDKGIVHAHTYGNAEYLRENVEKKYGKRLLFHGAGDRDVILAEHYARPDDTVLVSPSMAEGVDLKDDYSRFQIIMKVPYPYLGDPLVKRKMELNEMWYPYQTIKIICQMLGRSVRNMDDRADTYILDSNFASFYRRYKGMFPSWFHEAYRVMPGIYGK